ncbi:hypothetical protein [Listeria booriae]|uniref:Phage-Barnase-EndoU-ColicinE5/D-RelE like nuclease 4 domain-containing protein n=1 Tax=Listeria booriae TaxID=1552123 RepID=A0A841W5D2_9LIST|nr:hypothetical protein [Listeria booriae]MBC1228779.1 hypothetical protein [Listeria booriae]MBC1318421.1 hypothetical protein [Listeria booriae]
MLYDENYLQNFSGEINPESINICELANSLEKFVTNREYRYSTDHKDIPNLILHVNNENIPHLLGLSRSHHVGLSTYQPKMIFEELKGHLTLNVLRDGDERWFPENQYKLIGCMLLYQIFNQCNCEIYTTLGIPKTHKMMKRFTRDNIHFIFVKAPNNLFFSVELSTSQNNENGEAIYFPRSLKLNDDKVIQVCNKVNVTNLEISRLSTKKRKHRRK